MADISLRHKHELGLEKAKELTRKIASDVQGEFPSLIKSIDWNGAGTEAKLKGRGFSGTFSVSDNTMGIDVSLSLIARPFKDKVEKKIKDRITQYFG